ncbi:MAG: ABC transporter ATP-binding protein [Clostridiaceae bacterium]|nr:ABC transporter ATP-binding protein/permease [Clostridiales bacterium]MDD2572037.1 ABC transporter ATP-binding protein [Eubacteriales bacterium]MDD3540254.1 ABC transporter ATP-binding protein [Eubacteriales bacterium]MDD4186387.1 ABC transporter ATP-binding protein [Eubacteriales bacterium]NLG30233.1 ABC transporter ATP-binding protein [Clostridiaceae bacterium]
MSKTQGEKSLISRFAKYYRPYLTLFIADLFFAGIEGAVGLAFPSIIRYLINDIFTMPEKSMIIPILTKTALLMFALYVVEAISLYFVSSYGHILGARIETDMRRDLFSHMEKLSFSFFDTTSTGKMVSRLITDLNDITELAHHGPENLFISFFKLIGSFIILATIHVPLTLILIFFTVIMIVVTFGYRVKMRSVFMDNRRKIADVNAIVQDSLSGIRTVQSFSSEHIEMEKFHHGNEAFYHSKKRMYFVMGRYFTLNRFMQGMLYLTTLIAGGLFVVYGTLNPADVIAYILYINMFLDPIRTLIMFNEQFQQGMTGFKRMIQILDTEPDIADREGAMEAGVLSGQITFDSVSFSYEEEKILDNMSFTVDAGKTIALVGPSGVGKTTICSLIPRFYDVTEGRVMIDGIDVRDFTLDSLRDNIAVVQQEVYLFNSSVRDNICYGDWDATDDQVREAARRANIDTFIESLPEGYETMVGERGVRFSGGERQRISIARAFLRNPPILILDEATSSLDNISERAIQAALDDLSRDRTTLVIAHRLSTIRNADEILVLSEEGIAERGTHEELLEKGGEYAFLYRSQFEE